MEDLSTTHSQPEATLGKLYNPSHSFSWQTQSLYMLADWANGLAFKDIQFTRTGKPIIKIAEIKNGITDQTKFTDGSYDQRIEINAGDILFAWSGQPETSIGVSKWSGDSGWLNQHIFKISPKEGVDRDFFFFLLMYLNPYFVKIAKNKQTTGLGHVTKEDLRSMMVGVPEIEEQRDIVRLLLPIQQKIELLQAQSKDLEEMAQRLFKEWFVDFNFPSNGGKPYKISGGKMVESDMGTIPEGWSIDKLGSIVDVKGGTTPSTKESRFWNGEYFWTSPKDLSNCKDIFLRSTEKRVTADGLSKISSGLLPVGTVLLSSRAPIGYLAITDIPVAINQGYIAITPRLDYTNHFIYLWTRCHLDSIIAAANGSTFLEISKSSFKNIEIVKPLKETVREFQKIIRPIFEKIAANEEQSIKLSTLRGFLLPKLMSGEIAIDRP